MTSGGLVLQRKMGWKNDNLRHPFRLPSFSDHENINLCKHQMSGQDTDPSPSKDTLAPDSSRHRQEQVAIRYLNLSATNGLTTFPATVPTLIPP